MSLIQSLHERALALATVFKRAEHDLLEILQQVEAHGVHKKLGFSSMFAYATQSLKLPEWSAPLQLDKE